MKEKLTQKALGNLRMTLDKETFAKMAEQQLGIKLDFGIDS